MQSAHRGPRMTVLRRALAVAGLSLAGVFAGATAAQALTDVTDPVVETVATSVAEPVVVVVDVVEPVADAVVPVEDAVAPVAEIAEPVTAQVTDVITTVEPVTEVVAPVAEVVAPVTEAVSQVTAPVTESVDPVAEIAPVTDVAAPVVEVIESVVEVAPDDVLPDAPEPSGPASDAADQRLSTEMAAGLAADAGEPDTVSPAAGAPTRPGLSLSTPPVPDGEPRVDAVSVSAPAPPTSPLVGLSAATSSASTGGAGSRGADVWCQSAPWTPSLALTGLASGAQLCPPRDPYRDIPTSPA